MIRLQSDDHISHRLAAEGHVRPQHGGLALGDFQRQSQPERAALVVTHADDVEVARPVRHRGFDEDVLRPVEQDVVREEQIKARRTLARRNDHARRHAGPKRIVGEEVHLERTNRHHARRHRAAAGQGRALQAVGRHVQSQARGLGVIDLDRRAHRRPVWETGGDGYGLRTVGHAVVLRGEGEGRGSLAGGHEDRGGYFDLVRVAGSERNEKIVGGRRTEQQRARHVAVALQRGQREEQRGLRETTAKCAQITLHKIPRHPRAARQSDDRPGIRGVDAQPGQAKGAVEEHFDLKVVRVGGAKLRHVVVGDDEAVRELQVGDGAAGGRVQVRVERRDPAGGEVIERTGVKEICVRAGIETHVAVGSDIDHVVTGPVEGNFPPERQSQKPELIIRQRDGCAARRVRGEDRRGLMADAVEAGRQIRSEGEGAVGQIERTPQKLLRKIIDAPHAQGHGPENARPGGTVDEGNVAFIDALGQRVGVTVDRDGDVGGVRGGREDAVGWRHGEPGVGAVGLPGEGRGPGLVPLINPLAGAERSARRPFRQVGAGRADFERLGLHCLHGQKNGARHKLGPKEVGVKKISLVSARRKRARERGHRDEVRHGSAGGQHAAAGGQLEPRHVHARRPGQVGRGGVEQRVRHSAGQERSAHRTGQHIGGEVRQHVELGLERRVEGLDHAEGDGTVRANGVQAEAAPGEGHPHVVLVCPAVRRVPHSGENGVAGLGETRVGWAELHAIRHVAEDARVGVGVSRGVGRRILLEQPHPHVPQHAAPDFPRAMHLVAHAGDDGILRDARMR